MIGAIAKRFQDMAESDARRKAKESGIDKDDVLNSWPGLILARQGEIASQDAEECWNMAVKNSLFSASLKKRSTAYPVIIGTEGTIINALNKEMADIVPRWLLIDECHQVNWEDVIAELPETQYGQIVKELQRRCKSKHGHELIIIGYTGSPMRGTTPIKGDFWKHEICDISTEYLVDRGFLVPTIFGNPTVQYDLEKFKCSDEDGTNDFSAAQLQAMQKEILSQGTLTQQIMLQVVELTKDRGGVLVTCAGKRHCEEAAQYLPAGSYAIVTESMGDKQRAKVLQDAYDGNIKYIFQIGCLTTGINIPYWDTSVILRKIISLTLLIQLLGRGMRLLKPEQIALGWIKDDHLVLDYTDTMHELGGLYFNPILEQAELSRAKRDNETIPCPVCSTENSQFARRCIGTDHAGERCEYFFKSRECEDRYQGDKLIQAGCHAQNDPCARYCRKCDNILIDPNEKLTNKHYQKGDFHDVQSFNVRMTSNGEGLLFEYGIYREGKPYTAREVFWPSGENIASRNAWKTKAVFQHVKDPKAKSLILKERTAAGVMKYRDLFAAPTQITHRINNKNRDIVHRKVF